MTLLSRVSTRVMQRLGIGYEALKEINPKVIYCAITGYGQTGPYSNRHGHDNNYLSLAGVLDYSRHKDKSLFRWEFN